jgi:hypothetical protein
MFHEQIESAALLYPAKLDVYIQRVSNHHKGNYSIGLTVKSQGNEPDTMEVSAHQAITGAPRWETIRRITGRGYAAAEEAGVGARGGTAARKTNCQR